MTAVISWGDQVRRLDRDRFVCSLFAPDPEREGLFALYAFNAEIARVRETVREPLLGEIRLQWWRESIEAMYAGKPPGVPLLFALGETVRRFRLPQDGFKRLLGGREQDWREAEPASLQELVDYADATSGELAALAAKIVAPDDPSASDVARTVGIAWALTGLLRAIPHHARMRRVYLPADLSRDAGLDVGCLFDTVGAPQLPRVVERLAREAACYLTLARAPAHRPVKRALPVLLQASLAEHYLARLRRVQFDPFHPKFQTKSALPLVRLALRAFRGVY